MDGEARGATRRPSLALPLFVVALSSMVLPSTAQIGTNPQQYTNVSRILSILGTTWSGAGYDNNGDAHYLFRPDGEMTGVSRAACSPLCSIPCCPALPPPPCHVNAGAFHAAADVRGWSVVASFSRVGVGLRSLWQSNHVRLGQGGRLSVQ